MTAAEMREESRKLQHREQAVKGKIVAAARAVVPALLDAGRIHTAKELQELFFELDAINDAASSFYMANSDAVVAMLREFGEGTKGK